MRAVRYYGKEDIRIDDLADPDCKPNEVIVAPAYCGICGTDLHEYINGPHEYPAQPHPLTGEKVPVTLGHEFSGVVVQAGQDVKTLNRGDRVVVHGTLSCGQCEPCRNGNNNVCVTPGNIGQHGRGGGLAEKVAVGEHKCYKLPDHIGLDVGALCEPLAVSEHAIRRVTPELQSDQTALVLGCGAIGLAVTQLLRARGLKHIIGSEISKTRREAALRFGASHIVNPMEVDATAEVRRLTDGMGPHVVFECAGVPTSVQTAVDSVRIRGTVIEVAVPSSGFTFDVNPIVHKEVTYRGSLASSPPAWRGVIEMLNDGRLQPQKMITNIVPLERIVEEGLLGLARADERLVKIVVEVNSQAKLRARVDDAS